MLEKNNASKGKVTGSLQENMTYLNARLDVEKNFDIIYRVIHIGGKEACMYLIDGFCKDDLAQKLLQYFMDLTPDKMPEDMHGLSKQFTPLCGSGLGRSMGNADTVFAVRNVYPADRRLYEGTFD